MKLIKKDKGQLITENDLYNFVHQTFKDGTVPTDFAEFGKCFDDNTTDGSLCFSYQFGSGKDDANMLFFYPYFCAIPQRYHKNLRNDDYCNFNLVVLEYQFELAKLAHDLQYLKKLREQIEIINSNSIAFMQYDLFKYENTPYEDDCYEDAQPRGIDEIKTSIANYKKRYKEVIKFIDNKILSNNANWKGEESQIEENSIFAEDENETEAE